MADKYNRADGLRDHASGAGPIRLLVVDRQPAVRRGLKMRLGPEEDLEVVGEAGDADGAIPLARALRPDVILSDVGMPGGIATTEALRAAPHGAVVVFTLRYDSATRERAGEAGVAAFVIKRWSQGACWRRPRRWAARSEKSVAMTVLELLLPFLVAFMQLRVSNAAKARPEHRVDREWGEHGFRNVEAASRGDDPRG